MQFRPLLEAAVSLGAKHDDYDAFIRDVTSTAAKLKFELPEPPSADDAASDGSSWTEWLSTAVCPAYVNDGHSKCIWFGFDELNMPSKNIETAGVESAVDKATVPHEPDLDGARPKCPDYMSTPLQDWLARCDDDAEIGLLFFGWPAYIAFQLNQNTDLFQGIPVVIGDHSGAECVELK